MNALGALIAVFLPMGFAWAIVHWVSVRHRRGKAAGRDTPRERQPPDPAKRRHALRQAHGDPDERRHRSADRESH
ncbi:hypothetical protein [Variovorax saccharolyticus]|uniref:hypothetical protein n=1 Tax=Variovorax saccharolyticus TaxID=3053516 RepID=UPI0025781868|nr:hypothetical protein [Variovorax sp. J31P216]